MRRAREVVVAVVAVVVVLAVVVQRRSSLVRSSELRVCLFRVVLVNLLGYGMRLSMPVFFAKFSD